MAWLRPLLALYRRHLGRMAIGALLGALTLVGSIGLLALSGWFITATALAGLAGAGVVFDMFRPGAGVRFFALLRTVARYGERLATHDATLRLLAELRGWLFRRLIPKAGISLGRLTGGDLLNRLTADIESLDTLYLKLLTPLAVAIVISGAAIVLLWLVAPALAIVMAIGLVAAGILVPVFARQSGRRASSAAIQETAVLRRRAVEGLEGMADLLMCDAGSRHASLLARSGKAREAARARLLVVGAWSEAGNGLLADLCLLTVLLLGLGLVAGGALAAPMLVLAMLGTLAVFEAVAPLPGAFAAWDGLARAAQRILGLVEADDGPGGDGEVPPGNEIRLSGVHVRYPGAARAALAGVSLDITEGSKVAVIGRSGAGKTTLGRVILGLDRPEGGTVQVGGADLSNVAPELIWQRIGVLDQAAPAFDGTVAENLRLAKPEATDAELWTALSAADLAGTVEAMPDQLAEPLGPGGQRLSGGERRRLCLARLMLQDRPILIMDEPFEGLSKTDAERVRALVLGYAEGRTVILITHRTEGLEATDRIIRLDAGRIVEEQAGKPVQ